ncbi:DUF3558 domain-containing protein [Pseudonocardiaceae bacterium YIM PH 21723]|nr:DUF3558 domain-containing protein [Pseudonocardiaceae bacterium YIM PH 21723]
MRTRNFALVLAATALVIAGCNGSSESSTSSSAPAPSSSSGAPKVEKPIDTAKFQADPCSLLTEAQIQALGTTDKKVTTAALGPACRWTSGSKGLYYGATFVTANKDGLSSLYGQKDTLKLFRPVAAIQGHPALIYGQTDGTANGACTLAIGLTDQLTISLGVDASNAPEKSDPCGYVTKFGDTVMTDLKGGS